jgi:hypothetical protein
MVTIFKKLQHQRSKVDSCLHCMWTESGLLVQLSWVDNFLIMGPTGKVLIAKEEVKAEVDCDNVGKINEKLF